MQHAVYQENWYDALGRRVLVENRADGASGLTSGQLDTESSTSSGAFGQVISLHANGIDAPVAVRKAGNTTIAPYANWKGDYEVGTTADGTPTSSCTGTTSCPALDWPGGNENADGQKVLPAALDTWWGSLITGKTDPSGMKYMRNRYYNPSNGQFTQQDPIGLAGGINLYGFASGDPVNYTDPFGLCILNIPCPQGFVDAVAGFGDGASFGLSGLIRRNTPGGDGVDYGSGAYVGGVVVGTAAAAGATSGLAGEASVAGAEVSVERSAVGVGEHAGESIPAGSAGRNFTTAERAEMNRIGGETGCHTCGARTAGTKSGNFVPDHQPPSSVNPAGNPQRLYPQCIQCSRQQGLDLARMLRKGGTP